MSRKLTALLSIPLLAACFVCLPATGADDDAEPKHTIKQVMKAAMKGPLLKKVASGEASDDEKKQLHSMMVSMSKHKPPKGEADSWNELTGALVKAAHDAVEGTEGAGDALKKAANCKGCHSKHKG